MWYYIIIVSYKWYADPAYNALDLWSDECLISLNPMQSFKVVCMECNLLMDTSTQKRSPHNHPTAGQFILII